MFSNKMVNVILPMFPVNSRTMLINKMLMETINDNKMSKYIDDNINLFGFFGNFKNTKMSSSNYNSGIDEAREHLDCIRDFKKYLKEQSLSVFLDISNVRYSEKVQLAYYDNCILDIFQDDTNYSVISSTEAHDYIAANFNYKFVLSDICRFFPVNGLNDISFIETCELPDKEIDCEYILNINNYCHKCRNQIDHLMTQCAQNKTFKPAYEWNAKYNFIGVRKDMCLNVDKQLSKPLVHNKSKIVNNPYVSYIRISSYPFYTLSDYTNIITSIFIKEPYREYIRNMFLHALER